MSNLVIVALPREDDPVWKISSEKVPHMTILFLGSADNPDRAKMAEFLEHAASTTLTRFYLDVDRRGKLGEDEADVVFFQDSWDLPRLEEFRSQLLKFDAIKTAYDSTPQYEGWTPHLTLGYPETPAKPFDERIYMVGFDRIALWDGDYQGVEFLLKSNDVSEVMMSDQSAIGMQFLAHYGVKGMKWGVRKRRETKGAETVEKIGFTGKTKVKATGGTGQAAVPDAVKAAIQKQTFKKSGAAALSNAELRELAQRLQLEQQVTQLAGSPGQKFVSRQLGGVANQQTQRVANQKAAEVIDSKLRKKK